MKTRHFSAALAAFALLALAGCGGKKSPYDDAISSLIIGLVVAGLLSAIIIRFLRQRINGCGSSKGGGIATLLVLAILPLAGCGGGGSSATPPAFAGVFTGGEILLKADRGGGGPVIFIGSTTVQASDGRFGATVELDLGQGQDPIFGSMIGSVSNQGLVTATVNLAFDSGTISIGGGPLRWQDGRGGPNRVLSGPVAVTYSPAGAPQVQYLLSTLKLWQ